MQHMKLLGTVLIMCGCIALSFFYERKERTKIQNLIKMKEFILFARSKIDLFLTPVSVILNEFDDEIINSVVTTEFKNINEYFNTDDCEYIIKFFSSLGKGMKNEQLSLCDYTVSCINNSIEKADAEFKTKIKVFRTLAIFGGASVIILII